MLGEPPGTISNHIQAPVSMDKTERERQPLARGYSGYQILQKYQPGIRPGALPRARMGHAPLHNRSAAPD
jgi:hypothetical protein